MRKFLLSIAGVLAMFTTTVSSVSAAAPLHELSPKDAVRLIRLRSNVPENSVEISFIVDGVSKWGEFEATHVRRVAAIHPVRGGNSQSRKLVFYDLFWNESLGWFMWESRLERTGEAIYIWSELKGEIVNR